MVWMRRDEMGQAWVCVRAANMDRKVVGVNVERGGKGGKCGMEVEWVAERMGAIVRWWLWESQEAMTASEKCPLRGW